VPGGIVLVDTGTYHENIDFRGKGILVTSKFHTTGDTSYISRTIIDGSSPSNQDSASVVRFISIPGSCPCIKGFTLKYGSGTKTLTKDLTPTNKGGGIICLNSSPTITNNIIISNSADGGCGGGIYCDYSSSPKIINNVIKGNRAYSGGGIFGGSAQTIIANNLIFQNKAHAGGGIDMASGIITNNTIDGDSALAGGGIHVYVTICRIENNIVVNSQKGGGIYLEVYPDSTISYNNVWHNTDGNFLGYGQWGQYGDTTLRTNRNQTPCDSFYNIIRDPKFVDGYHLDGSSPCINAGDNNAPALPAFDFEGNTRVMGEPQEDTFFVDMGAYEYQPAGFSGFAKIAGGDRKDSESKSSGEIPDKFSLLQNYPNPFNPTTIVQFKIPQPAKVSLKVYNILGQLVRVLVDEEKPTGIYQSVWDGKDAEGKEVASGIYFYRLQAGKYDEVRKMVLVK
jgi:hypothetical protein